LVWSKIERWGAGRAAGGGTILAGGAARWLGSEASSAKGQGCKPRLIKNVEMCKCPLSHRNINNNSAFRIVCQYVYAPTAVAEPALPLNILVLIPLDERQRFS
jgi:hypothetical protein